MAQNDSPYGHFLLSTLDFWGVYRCFHRFLPRFPKGVAFRDFQPGSRVTVTTSADSPRNTVPWWLEIWWQKMVAKSKSM